MQDRVENNRVFRAACAGMFLFGIAFITMGSVTADLREKFDLSQRDFGALFALLPLGIIAGTLWFGPEADRWGYKRVFLAAGFSLFLGFTGIGFAPDTGLLKFSVFLFGFGGGVLNGACNAVVALISPENKVARLSIMGVFYGIGALAMPLVLGWLAQISYSDIIAGIAVLTLCYVIWFFFVPFPKSQSRGSRSLRRTLQVFRLPHVRWIAGFLFLQMSLEALFNNWSTSYLSGAHKLSDTRALFALSFLIAGMTLMRTGIGSVLRKMEKASLLRLSLALLLAGMLGFGFFRDFLPLLFSMLLLGAGLAGGVPLMLGIAGELPEGQSGSLFSALILAGLLGNVSMNYLTGRITAGAGIDYFYHIIALVWVIMAGVALAIIRSYQQYQKQNKA